MLDKPRIRAFASFARQYGVDKLTNCLLRSKDDGILYHCPGQLTGNYGQCATEAEIHQMLLTVKHSHN